MTTINNYESLIKKVGGIEKAREIVEGAPEWASSYCKDSSEYYSVHDDFECCYNLNNLRTAIAQYDKTWVEKRFGIKKWYPIPEHHMCTDKQADQQFKVGNRVHVDFLSANRTEFSGQKIKGDGVIDRVEDGYIFGRLDCGQTFMCPETDAVVINDDAENEFRKWIKASQEYQTLVFQHGERLFIRRDGQYDILSIRLARRLWTMIEGHQFTFNVMAKSLAEAKNRFDAASNLATQWHGLKIKGIAPEHRAYEDALSKCADELEKALRGERE